MRPIQLRYLRWRNTPRWAIHDQRRCYSSPSHDPLRILFCGADEFSIYSLRALHDLHLRQPSKVASIDVVCKTDKRVGRGLKKTQEVPIKGVAGQLGLRTHQINTFTRWSPPTPDDESINLIIAVSFGLLVPPRILSAAKYGGLNVHPSMLPDLRGPAPLHHALLNRDTRTGVTLQTLHPQHFDQGRIVAQTPLPGVPIPDAANATHESLLQFLGPLGAQLLCESIESGAFLRPESELRSAHEATEATELRHAPKIGPEYRHINWSSWPASEILLRDRVLGKLWDATTSSALGLSPVHSKPLRLSYAQWEDVTLSHIVASAYTSRGVAPVLASHRETGQQRLCFSTVDDRLVSPQKVTVEGRPQKRSTDKVFLDALLAAETGSDAR
ncbi:Methionyl-tRNA formyltransferase [Zalaria obscura]|uniref:Methionyl-tRNA formyltransferase n=1 Tax=Zalaria obscura TaxID=2024903 RepID=A0ACC3SIJ9_9PEZI